jgi:hypothetical protein
MEKRTFKRIPADLDFHCFDINNFGTVRNISEKGMFIESQKITFPLEMQFEISISAKEEKLNILVKVTPGTATKVFKHIKRFRLSLKVELIPII